MFVSHFNLVPLCSRSSFFRLSLDEAHALIVRSFVRQILPPANKQTGSVRSFDGLDGISAYNWIERYPPSKRRITDVFVYHAKPPRIAVCLSTVPQCLPLCARIRNIHVYVYTYPLPQRRRTIASASQFLTLTHKPASARIALTNRGCRTQQRAS